MKARVYRSSQREFVCKLMDSGEMIEATALGNLLKGDTIVVGDEVEVEMADNNEYQIVSVDERRSEIFRILVRESRKKVTASNVDYLIILSSVSKPAFKRGIIDRFLVRAHQWGVHPLVIFNKMDQHNPDEVDIIFERDRLLPIGVECFEICAKFPEDYSLKYLDAGLEELRNKIAGKTSIFVGQSGVGKSKTIGQLSDGMVDLKTQEVGKAGKGSHTTTWSEIIDCGNFWMIDSPGIRSFSLEDIREEDLIEYWPDLEKLAVECKFNNCEHEEKSKGCRFHSIPEGRERELIMSRLESYKRIKGEITETPHWEKKY